GDRDAAAGGKPALQHSWDGEQAGSVPADPPDDDPGRDLGGGRVEGFRARRQDLPHSQACQRWRGDSLQLQLRPGQPGRGAAAKHPTAARRHDRGSVMMAFPQLASLGTAVSLLSCCLGLAAQTLPAEQASAWQAAATLTEGVNTNVLLGFQRPKADATTALQLDLGRSWKGPHWDFSATYTPQAMTFARNRSLDYVAHAYHQAWQAAT